MMAAPGPGARGPLPDPGGGVVALPVIAAWPAERCLHPARDRPVLRRHVFAEVEKDLVDIAPAPAFGRIVALDDRVSAAVEMRGGVAVRAVVAAADMAA